MAFAIFSSLVGVMISPMAAAPASDPTVHLDMAGEISGAVTHGSAKLAGAVVSIAEVAGSFRAPTEPVMMDQLNKVFLPHVLAVLKGTTVRFHNSDPFYHNVFASSRVRTFNVSQANSGDYSDVQFPNLGVVPIRCHVHPNMKAYVVVLSNPFFAITGAQGTYRIGNVSPGNYTLKIWSEIGTATKAVTVPATGKATVDISL